ncbi:hypothetical protein KSD_25890 [Ktedonobacter sp. SOSP1-85]|uniref:tetratricopeptide repeat protein n=1 Tax=Ktedonobacter sp. SOSP1-85 TaxID=2778367 RepID=UPI001915D69B|nr:tetratricopeptide repeat protein [Ktedonobacter sp. SOSP1-85]GHO74818.1 hypothetical protein KSD_25890 [Ktedonobacter sp. SOSP1-85]
MNIFVLNIVFVLLFLLLGLYFVFFLLLHYLAKRRHTAALIALTSWLLHLPLFRSQLYGMRARAYGQQGDCRLAILDLDYVLEGHPHLAWAYYERGTQYASLKDHGEAIEDFSEALDLHPRLVPAYYARGLVYSAVREEENALNDFGAALALNPRVTAIYFHRALLHLRSRDYKLALQDIDMLIRLQPDEASTYKYQGIFYYQLKDFEQALSCFNYALQLDPGDAATSHQRALVHMALHQLPQAQNDLSQALARDSLSLCFHYSLAALQFCLELPALDTEAMANRLEQIATLNSAPELSLLCCAIALYLRQQPEEALASLQQALVLDPNNSNIHLWLCIVYASLQHDQEARSALDIALESSLPLILFTPLQLVAPLNPGFYQQDVLPILSSLPSLPAPTTN